MTRSSWLPYLCGAGAIACWASLAVAIGESLRVARPETVLFWGLLVAGISLTLWERIRWEWNRRERQRWEALGNGRGPSAWLEWPGWRGVLHGVYGIWGYHTLLVLAFANAPQVEANILNYTWTLWIVVLGAMLPGHRLTTRIVAAGALGFAGVALVIGGEGLLAGRALPSLSLHGVGFALALAASLVWSSFTVFMRLMVTPGRGRMAVFCLLSAAAALGFALARGAPLALPWSQATVVIYLGAGAPGAVLRFVGIRRPTRSDASAGVDEFFHAAAFHADADAGLRRARGGLIVWRARADHGRGMAGQGRAGQNRIGAGRGGKRMREQARAAGVARKP